MKSLNKDLQVCVIGLGYVGLPLALEFSKHFSVTGYDLSKERIEALLLLEDKMHYLPHLE